MKRHDLWRHVNRTTLVLRLPWNAVPAKTAVELLWFGNAFATVRTADSRIFKLPITALAPKSTTASAHEEVTS